MKVKFMYKGDKQWTAGSYDLELILYQGSMFPTRLFPIENLQDLGYLIEQNKTIFVLREPMEGLDDGVEYTSIEYNIDVLEREDNRNKGKGYALEWAFRQLKSEQIDAFVILVSRKSHHRAC